MTPCAEPLSWLRLERHHLGELAPAEDAAVRRHLAGCAECSALLQQIEGDARPLPPLPEVSEPWWRRWRLVVLVPAVAAALWAVLPPSPEVPGPRVATKGGEVALTLVRERAGAVAEDPESFRAGDRFKALLTAPPGEHRWALVVYQGQERFLPLGEGQVEGRNRAPLPGAFALDGAERALVCVALDRELPARPSGADACVVLDGE